MQNVIASGLFHLSLAVSAMSQPASLTALETPQFVEAPDGVWHAFPAARAAVAVRDSSIMFASGDGERSVELQLPGGWRVRAGATSATRFTVIRADASRQLTAATSLVFTAVDGGESIELSFLDRETATVQRFIPAGVSPAAVVLRVTEAPGMHGLTEVVTDPARWTPTGTGRDEWRPSPLVLATAPGPLVQQLVFGTFLGGSSFDNITDVALSASGDLLVAGGSSSLDFPSTPGVLDPASGPGTDAFLASISNDGSQLHFATFFGGSGTDYFEQLLEEPDETVLLVGGTDSTDLPMPARAFDATLSGPADPFVARLTGSGTALVAATYIGSSTGGVDRVSGLLINDRDGSVVLTGTATDDDWPTTAGTYQPQVASGTGTAYVSRLDHSLSSLTASTYFGDATPNSVTASCVLSDGSVVFAGPGQLPQGLPEPPAGRGAFSNASSADNKYLVRMSADLSTVVWSTWIPAAIDGIHEKQDGSLVLFGVALGGFPTTAGAFNESHGGPFNNYEYVVCNITADAQQLIWSTYINSGTVFNLASSELDDQGRLTFTSAIVTLDYPFTPDAFDTTFSGLSEFQITVVNADGSDILYASLIGVGTGSQDPILTMVLDGCNGAFVAGKTTAPNFPTTPGAIDTTHNGNADGWIVRITTLNPWTNLGHALAGSAGRPRLAPSGPLCDGDPTSLDIEDGLPNGLAFLVIGLSELNGALKGGVLVPSPDVLVSFPLDGNGASTIGFSWPPSVPSGFDFWLQSWIVDPGAVAGLSATNGVRGTTP